MAILSREIVQQEIQTRNLIEGVPQPGDPMFDECFEPASYDLRVGKIITADMLIEGEGRYLTLKSGEVCTVETLEAVNLPSDIAATVFPPNKLSVQGLLVLNPGHVDPGFSGHLTARIVNLRKTEFQLDVGRRVFTIIFERLEKPTQRGFMNTPRPERTRELRDVASTTMQKTLFEVQLEREFRERFEEDYLKKSDFTPTFLRMLIYPIGLIGAVYAFLRIRQDFGAQLKPQLAALPWIESTIVVLALCILVIAINQTRQFVCWIARRRR